MIIPGLRIELEVDESGKPCYRKECGTFDFPVFVQTVPKSGTYLVAEILKNLGVIFSGIHLSHWNLVDERNATLEQLRTNPDRFNSKADFPTAVSIIKNGQFAVGHIPYKAEYVDALSRFRKIITYRGMRDMICSYTRYYGYIQCIRTSERRRERKLKDMTMGEDKVMEWLALYGFQFSELISSIIKWIRESNTIICTFDDLINNSASEVRRMAEFLGLNITHEQAAEIGDRSLKTETMTSFPNHADYRRHWSDKLEDQYQTFGFDEIDSELRSIRKSTFKIML